MSSRRTCKCIANSTGKRCKNRIREEEKYCRFHKDCDEQKSVVKKSPLKEQEEEELARTFRELKIERNSPRKFQEEYEPGSVRKPDISSTRRSPSVLFSGGFAGILNMIGSYTSEYYNIKVNFIDIVERKQFVYEFVLAIPDEVLNDYFLKYVENGYIEPFLKQIINIHRPELSKYIINRIQQEKIEYRDIENKEEIIILDIYDLVYLFNFNDTLQRKLKPRDNKVLKGLIESAKSKNYAKYNKLLDDLNLTLIHELLPYISVDDKKLVEPLFMGEIIFKFETMHPLDAQNIRGRTADMDRKIEIEKYRIEYSVKKFIVQVLIESIQENNVNLCNVIINNVIDYFRYNTLLIDYCIKVAQDYNRAEIIEILSNKRTVMPSD